MFIASHCMVCTLLDACDDVFNLLDWRRCGKRCSNRCSRWQCAEPLVDLSPRQCWICLAVRSRSYFVRVSDAVCRSSAPIGRFHLKRPAPSLPQKVHGSRRWSVSCTCRRVGSAIPNMSEDMFLFAVFRPFSNQRLDWMEKKERLQLDWSEGQDSSEQIY